MVYQGDPQQCEPPLIYQIERSPLWIPMTLGCRAVKEHPVQVVMVFPKQVQVVQEGKVQSVEEIYTAWFLQ